MISDLCNHRHRDIVALVTTAHNEAALGPAKITQASGYRAFAPKGCQYVNHNSMRRSLVRDHISMLSDSSNSDHQTLNDASICIDCSVPLRDRLVMYDSPQSAGACASVPLFASGSPDLAKTPVFIVSGFRFRAAAHCTRFLGR